MFLDNYLLEYFQQVVGLSTNEIIFYGAQLKSPAIYHPTSFLSLRIVAG